MVIHDSHMTNNDPIIPLDVLDLSASVEITFFICNLIQLASIDVIIKDLPTTIEFGFQSRTYPSVFLNVFIECATFFIHLSSKSGFVKKISHPLFLANRKHIH